VGHYRKPFGRPSRCCLARPRRWAVHWFLQPAKDRGALLQLDVGWRGATNVVFLADVIHKLIAVSSGSIGTWGQPSMSDHWRRPCFESSANKPSLLTYTVQNCAPGDVSFVGATQPETERSAYFPSPCMPHVDCRVGCALLVLPKPCEEWS
jgi:hypothetical protein